MTSANMATGTHDQNGWYAITLDDTDTAVVGRLQLSCKKAGALMVLAEFQVVEEAVYDALFTADATGFATIAALATAQADISAILTDTADMQPKLGTPAGVDMSADIAAVKADTAATLVDTADMQPKLGTPAGADISTDIAAVKADTAATLVDTADMQPKLGTPAGADISTDIAAVKADTAATLVDTGTTLDTKINDIQGATFSTATDSLEAIRDRGDAAWTTGGGGSITDILNLQPIIPTSIDLANTATVRLGLMLINALDDLPSTAEITPGTIDIDRKAIGGTTWTSVVAVTACSESNGLIYFDEVFDSATGYAEGDSIRITFKSQKVTVAANDYEITDASGVMFQTEIRQTMRGTNSAALATALATAQADLNILTGVDGAVIASGTQTFNMTGNVTGNLSGSVGSLTGHTVQTGDNFPRIGVAGAGLTDLGGMSTTMKAQVNTEADTALSDYDAPTRTEATADKDEILAALPADLVSGTADSGTTTTMVDAARTEADTDYWKDSWIKFTSGTISGQVRLITGFTPVTDTITFAPATTQAVGTNTYEIIPAANIAAIFGHTPQTGDTYALAAGATGFTAIDTVVDAILVDTGTTLPATLATAQADLDTLTGVDGAVIASGTQTFNMTGNVTGNLSGSVGSLTGHTPQTGDTFALAAGATGFTAIDTVVDAILVDTADMQPKIGTPAVDLAADIAAISDPSDPVELVDTTIATLASQTSFTLTAGSTDNDAYNEQMLICIDQATSTQVCVARISDYTGSTKTITLAADPGVFTMAIGDTVKVVATPTQMTASSIGVAVWGALRAAHKTTGTFGEQVSPHLQLTGITNAPTGEPTAVTFNYYPTKADLQADTNKLFAVDIALTWPDGVPSGTPSFLLT